MKNIVRRFVVFINPALRLFFSIFYDRKYLQGQWFDEGVSGWLKAWKGIFFQKIMGFNRHVPFPCSPLVRVSNGKNIEFHPDDLNNFHSFGIYYQSFDGKIIIGKGTYIGPNVGLITSGHNPLNPEEHLEGKDVRLGEKCWIGMNSVILPGVELGPNTVVGAGAVVNKSFPEGHCIIGGVPARLIKNLTAKE
jgi:acetyltransferase-like isoleucine patch superfamily enzyme